MLHYPKPIIGKIGGKSKLSNWITSFILPLDFSIYVEPFAGSAAILFNLYNSSKFEELKSKDIHPRIILNDKDSRIINLFKVCREDPHLLAFLISFTPYSREEYLASKKVSITPPYEEIDELENEIEAARKYLTLNWQSQCKHETRNWQVTKSEKNGSGSTRQNGYDYQQWNQLGQRIINASSLFKQCYIENSDYESIFKRWDSPHTLFYCDPPYYSKEDSYQETFSKKDHRNLAKILHNIEGQALVSYYPHPEILKLYQSSEWNIYWKNVSLASSSSNTRPTREEILITKTFHSDNYTQLNIF